MDEQDILTTLKILIIGESGVGKSRFVLLLLKWIESFLHQRRQRVTINGVKSDWGSVTSGVPQGSVLGPILFILFVNSISDEGDILLFADDTKLYKIIDTDEDQLAMQEDINKLQDRKHG